MNNQSLPQNKPLPTRKRFFLSKRLILAFIGITLIVWAGAAFVIFLLAKSLNSWWWQTTLIYILAYSGLFPLVLMIVFSIKNSGKEHDRTSYFPQNKPQGTTESMSSPLSSSGSSSNERLS